MQAHSHPESQNEKDTNRIEAFSDGIFCVGITLLAIAFSVEIKNNPTNGALAQALLKLWPEYVAYIISFVNVLLAWIGHHSLFKLIRKPSTAIMVANGLLLLLVALVPFPSKILGQYVQTGAFKTATVFYTGYFVLISLAFRLLWHVASYKKVLLVHSITDEQVKKTTRTENIGLIANTVIMLVSFITPWGGLILSFAMWIYWIF